MIRALKIVWAVVLAAALAAVVTPVFAFTNPWTTEVSCPPEVFPYSNSLTALVTLGGGLYHYEYTLNYYESFFGDPLTEFSVGNLGNMQFLNAGNDHGFTNPVWNEPNGSRNSVLWQKGASVPVGNIVKFWYDSYYTYTDVDVTLSGGLPSSGRTLGMVPDPSSLAGFAVGLSGLGVIGFRKLWYRPRG